MITLCTVVSLMAQYTVTFFVDISDSTSFNPDITDIYISSDFAGWPMPGSNPLLIMNVTEDPNVYVFTHIFPEGENVIQYKYFFVYDGIPTWDYGEWNGDPNRNAAFIGSTILDNTFAAQPIFVSFQIDMTGIIFDPDTTDIYISGTFADSAQPGTLDYWKMSDPLLETYELNRWIYSGEQQYKYYIVNHGIPSWEHSEWQGYPNRIVNIVNDTVILDYWGIITLINNIPEVPIGNIYPNPCYSSISITLFENGPVVNKIEVRNATGILVSRVEYIDSQTITMETDMLSSGIYFIVLYTNQGVKTAKFIKEQNH